MAAIDHTVIVYKNGEYLKEPDLWDEDGNYINTLPFEYTRDGEITDIFSSGGNLIPIYEDIKWYRDEDRALYERDGISDISKFRLSWWIIMQAIKWKLHLMRRVCYEREVGVWKSGDVEVYIYLNNVKQTCVSFYKDATDTYVVLGGYGHYENPYTHFMGRGYGDEFEEKMASEAYQWLCSDILSVVSESIFDDWLKIDEWTHDMQKALRYEEKW